MPTFEQNMVETLRSQHIAWNAERTLAQAEAKAATAQAELAQAMQEANPEQSDAKASPVTLKAAYVGKGNVVYCIGAYAGNEDRDLDTLHISPLVQMAHDFVKSPAREFNGNHSTANKGAPLDMELVESMTGAPILQSGRVLAYGDDMPNDDPVTGIDLKGDPIAWFCALEIHDPAIVELVKSGAIVGTSWEAYVSRRDS